MRTVDALMHDATRRLEAAGIVEDARLEAEVLLAHAAGIDRTHLLARLVEPARDDEVARSEALLARRIAREPLSYITGICEFYGLPFACTPAALIPRPETEMLVDLALEEAERRGEGARVIDVGTGTGAIAVAIAAQRPGVGVVATDTSTQALALARANAKRHGVTRRIEFVEGDLFAGRGAFDVVVANLPYVSEADWPGLQPEIREHEPRAALVAGPRGTEAVERLLAEAPAHLAPGGVLAAEVGDGQGAELLAAAGRSFPAAVAVVLRDFAGLERVLVVRA